MGKKVYAVRKGRQTGLFDTWAECQKQISGYSGAEFKGFSNVEEAKLFLEGEVQDAGDAASVKRISKSAKNADKEILKLHTGRMQKQHSSLSVCASEAGMIENMYDADTAVAYVDGSFDKVSGDFSYGMVILYQGEELKFGQKIQDKDLAQMHNVAGEIKGAEAAMRYALEHGYKKIIIYHDYEGIAKWCSGAWQANKAGTKAYKAYYDSVCGRLAVEFVKVKGHSGDRYNDMADALAKEALGIGKQR